MEECKIAIIIPTYNRWWCVENAINSVLNQKYLNFYLIVIDDWSTDNTRKIIEKYKNRLTYLYKDNEWKLIAVNYILNNYIDEDTDLIFILDSDDEFLENWFSKVNNIFQKNPNFVSYHYGVIFPDFIKDRYSELYTDKKSIIVSFNDILKWKIYKWDYPGFINYHFLGDVRFNESIPNWMENIFWFNLNKKWNSIYINDKIIFVDSSRLEKQERDNLTSYYFIFSRAKSMIIWYDILIDENYSYLLENKSIFSSWYFEQFQWAIVDRQLKKWFNSLICSIRYWTCKQKIKNSCFFVLFLFPKKFIPLILRIYYKIK